MANEEIAKRLGWQSRPLRVKVRVSFTADPSCSNMLARFYHKGAGLSRPSARKKLQAAPATCVPAQAVLK